MPGGWSKRIVSLSGDDTFTSTSTADAAQPQPAVHGHQQELEVLPEGQWARCGRSASRAPAPAPSIRRTRSTGRTTSSTSPLDRHWRGEFIKVDPAVARGDNAGKLPQDDLEDWSNTNNVFQFIRVEDIAYDPDNPRVVYFADTGNTRLYPEPTHRAPVAAPDGSPLLCPPVGAPAAGSTRWSSMPQTRPRWMSSASSPTEAPAVGPRSAIPGNPAGVRPTTWTWATTASWSRRTHPTPRSGCTPWETAPGDWTHVATVDQDQDRLPATSVSQAASSTSQAGSALAGGRSTSRRTAASLAASKCTNNQSLDPTFRTWTDGPPPPGGNQYRLRREAGQLLLMNVPGS